MSPELFNTIYGLLDGLAYDFPNLEWETDENDQIVIWEEDNGQA